MVHNEIKLHRWCWSHLGCGNRCQVLSRCNLSWCKTLSWRLTETWSVTECPCDSSGHMCRVSDSAYPALLQLVNSFMTLGILLRIARCFGPIPGHLISTEWCNPAWNTSLSDTKLQTIPGWEGETLLLGQPCFFLSILVKNSLIAWFHWVQVTWAVTQGPSLLMPSAWATHRKSVQIM